jgi:hypothetical protein
LAAWTVYPQAESCLHIIFWLMRLSFYDKHFGFSIYFGSLEFSLAMSPAFAVTTFPISTLWDKDATGCGLLGPTVAYATVQMAFRRASITAILGDA